jgi:polysaccharide biosynthesis transport protein
MNMENGIETHSVTLPQKPFDLFGSLFRHWLKILVFGSFLFVLSLPLCWLKKQPYYKTEGQLLVSPSSTTFIAKADEDPISSYYTSYVRTQVGTIAAQENLEKTVQSFEGKLKEIFLPGQMPVTTAAKILGRRITVTHTSGTHFIVVGIEGKTSEGLADAVNRLMAVYLERVQEGIESLDSRRLKYLEDERSQIKSEIEEYMKQYEEISQKTGTIYFREGTTVYNTALDGIEKEYIKAYGQRIEKENLLMAARRDAKTIGSLPLDAFVEELLQKSLADKQMDLYTYQQVESLKNSMEGLSDSNLDRQRIKENIESITQRAEQSKKTLKENAKRVMYEIREAQLKEKIIRLESEFEAAITAEQNIKEKRDGILAEKVEMSQQLLKGQAVEEKLTNSHAQLNRIEERISLLKLEARAPGRTTLSSEAREPVDPEGSNLKKLILISFVLSFGGMLCLAITYDVRDDRVRSKSDVLNAIGASTSWPISDYLLTRDKGIPFSRVTLEDSSNVVSKAIHSLSIRLNQERLKNGAKLVLFNGVDATSGTSEILVNVAYAMTLQCKKVVIVDSNLVNPGFSKILNLPESLPGLTDFLHSQLDFKACVVSCEERKIDVLPSGRMLSLNDINQLDRSKLHELFGMLKNEYDFILVDSCPILVSDLTEFAAVNADIVSLVVQGDRSTYKALHMVGTIYARLKVPAVAVVLNWGAPRHRSALQIMVHRLLAPIQQRMVIPPKWKARHGEPTEADHFPNSTCGWLNLVKKVLKIKRS